jgi:hypothetical protein
MIRRSWNPYGTPTGYTCPSDRVRAWWDRVTLTEQKGTAPLVLGKRPMPVEAFAVLREGL